MDMQDRLEKLTYLFNKYPSDKLQHGYLPFYAKYLPDTCRNMLEIGVDQGYSAKIWEALYGAEKLDLHLMDLFLNEDNVSTKWARVHGFLPLQGDQGDLKFLTTIPYQYEVITEDGSHRSDHQIITFKHLFLNNLRPGGVYFLEDTHCCKQPDYYGGEIKFFEDTVLWMFKKFLETGEITNVYFNEGEAAIYKNLIKSVEICADEKLIIIHKVD